ncbi:ArnT family glycosyltransferase [Oscillatoria salina]|uniref:ArnT family glycosyltransferase n=1 Tax=Oscillatoria salina TaxID=331517 RepID=UPI0013B7FB61|nr:glycosyltransferase family 39 protein [Oscillatoria salina]MBZ8183028.1 glycosyltransferase family 39 protein [Oscillatoria salina IIICB1]NET86611.1 glycosyltransferase family 39 protein [Kamptonema sp. SIO1D9]
MERQTFAWGRLGKTIRRHDRGIEWLWILGLLLAALILYLTNLGSLPLRDWDEGTIAQVAKEIWQGDWLFPTLWGEPYLNKPPLIHWAIASLYSFAGVSEWTTRLPSALLSAVSVPLLYCLGRELFPVRTPAVFSSLVYLTLLPVLRHGRLAMLDGPILCFTILTIWCTLRSRRDLRWALGTGIGLALIALTKGIMALLIAAIALSFLAWDTPRLLFSVYFWTGLFLGSVPAIAWYVAQWQQYAGDFLSTGILDQSLSRIWTTVENHDGPFWYYLLEIVKYPWPWLLFAVYGWRLAWENRNWGWAKLVLIWSGVYLVSVSLMATKLPWYILPLYPALALAAGAELAEVRALPSFRAYPRWWTIILAFLALVATVASIYFGITAQSDRSLIIILGAVALTAVTAAVLIERKDEQFISMLVWGMYVSLLLFVSSPHWIWELNEAFPVQPVAGIVKLTTSRNETVYTSFDYRRPSLDFYSEKPILPPPEAELEQLQQNRAATNISSPEELKLEWFQQYWQNQATPYLLLSADTLSQLNLESVQELGTAPPNFVLIGKSETEK